MAPYRRRGASRGSYTVPVGRALSGTNRGTRERTAGSARARTLALPAHGDPESVFTVRELEGLWDRHASSVYALAFALLGDERAAAQAVTLGMTDLAGSARSASTSEAYCSWARHVYWRSKVLAGQTTRTSVLPPAMVWLGQLAELHGVPSVVSLRWAHYCEAAGLLGVPPRTVADLLTSGLREAQRLAAGATAAPALASPASRVPSP